MKKQLSKCMFSILLCLAGMHCCIGQTLQAPRKFSIYLIVAPGDSTMQPGDTAFHANTQLNAQGVLLLNDTSGVEAVHITMGSTLHGSDLFDSTLLINPSMYNTQVLMGAKGYRVNIYLGAYSGLNTVYSEAYLIYPAGNSSVVSYAKR